MFVKPAVLTVIDTNILVPSIYSLTWIAQFIYDGSIVLVWNEFTYNEACEIIDRLAYHYRNRDINPKEAKIYLDYFVSIGYKVPEMPSSWPPVIKNDRDDDNFLWAALYSSAEYIISDDSRHMLKLVSFKGIPIGTPKEFFEWVKKIHPMKA